MGTEAEVQQGHLLDPKDEVEGGLSTQRRRRRRIRSSGGQTARPARPPGAAPCPQGRCLPPWPGLLTLSRRDSHTCVSQHPNCVCSQDVWADDAAKLFAVLLGLIAENKLCRVILGAKGFWIGFFSLVRNTYSVTIFCVVVDLFIIFRCICIICLKGLWLLL